MAGWNPHPQKKAFEGLQKSSSSASASKRGYNLEEFLGMNLKLIATHFGDALQP